MLDDATWEALAFDYMANPPTPEEHKRYQWADDRARVVNKMVGGRKLFRADFERGMWVRRERPDLRRIFAREVALFERVTGIDRI